MFINVLKEIKISDKDVYILTATADEVVINKNGGRGVMLFDHALARKSDMVFPEEIFIYRVFKKHFGNELVFFSCDTPANQSLMYSNLITGISFVIPLDSSFENVTFSLVYWWLDDFLILSDYNENFYKVVLNEKRIIHQGRSEIRQKMPDFYNLYRQAMSKKACTVYPWLYQYLFTDKQAQTINFFDMPRNQQAAVSNICSNAHDYEYKDGVFLLVSEKEIVLIDSDKLNTTHINPDDSYRFLRGIFLSGDKIVVLSRYHDKNKIVLYSLVR